MRQRGLGVGLTVAALFLLLGIAVAFAAGRFPVALADLAQLFLARLTGRPSGLPPAVETIVWQIRGPRILAALLVGSALATAGAAFQGLFRNPLVSPDILGASSGAALGAVLGIFFSLGVIGIESLAFVGGLIAVAAVYVIGSLLQSRDPILVLVLTGVVIGALLGAGVGLVKYLADPYNQLPAITFWLLGSLASVKLADLATVAPLVLAGLVPLVLFRWRIGVLSLGDDEARSLGVDVFRLRALVIGAATLMTASVVAVSGVIGWVGLMIPHIARMLVGPNFSRLLPASMLLGASFMLIVDMAARSIARVETPLGILTAVLGAPFFLWLLARGRRTWG